MLARTPRDFGILIRDTRRKLGLTQAELAARNRVTAAWLSWVENGKASAEIGMVLQLVSDLGIEIDLTPPAALTQDTEIDTPAVDQDEDDEYTPPPYTI